MCIPTLRKYVWNLLISQSDHTSTKSCNILLNWKLLIINLRIIEMKNKRICPECMKWESGVKLKDSKTKSCLSQLFFCVIYFRPNAINC